MTLPTISSPRVLARFIGLFHLIVIVGGVVAQGLISNRLIVFSSASTTATNILANRNLFQIGLTIFLIEMAANVATTTLFYELLRPVSKSVSLLSTGWGLTGCIIKTFARAFYIVPLFVLGGTSALSSFSSEQLQSIALVLLRLNGQGANLALPFFGLEWVLRGYLITRSTYLPRWLGVLSFISGLGWLTYFYPPLGSRLFVILALVALTQSAALIFWLLVFGVNEERWKEQATRSQ
jgi:Domain of unknown function (DUF4386)